MKKTTSELFVSYRYGDDFYEVFTSFDEADMYTEEMNEELVERLKRYKYISKAPYKTMTLAEAIEEIKDYVRDKTEQDIKYPEE